MDGKISYMSGFPLITIFICILVFTPSFKEILWNGINKIHFYFDPEQEKEKRIFKLNPFFPFNADGIDLPQNMRGQCFETF